MNLQWKNYLAIFLLQEHTLYTGWVGNQSILQTFPIVGRRIASNKSLSALDRTQIPILRILKNILYSDRCIFQVPARSCQAIWVDKCEIGLKNVFGLLL
jgi:hypothetical protein